MIWIGRIYGRSYAFLSDVAMADVYRVYIYVIYNINELHCKKWPICWPMLRDGRERTACGVVLSFLRIPATLTPGMMPSKSSKAALSRQQYNDRRAA